MSCLPLELRAVTCLREAASFRNVTAGFPAGTCTRLASADSGARDLLLRVAGLTEIPDAGDVLLAGMPTRHYNEEERDEARSQHLGFVFRAPFLLPAFSVVENVAMPLFRRSHVDATEARARTGDLLRFVNLMEAAEERVENLSPAAQHRVSLARALVNRPAVLLVEEFDAELTDDDLRGFRTLLHDACVQFGVAAVVSASAGWNVNDEGRVLRLDAPLEQRSTFAP